MKEKKKTGEGALLHIFIVSAFVNNFLPCHSVGLFPRKEPSSRAVLYYFWTALESVVGSLFAERGPFSMHVSREIINYLINIFSKCCSYTRWRFLGRLNCFCVQLFVSDFDEVFRILLILCLFWTEGSDFLKTLLKINHTWHDHKVT